MARVRIDRWDPADTVVAEGLVVPRSFRATASGPDLPVEVIAEVALVDGRLEPQEITLRRRPGGTSITSDSIRLIPVERLVRAMIQRALSRLGTPTPLARLTREGAEAITRHGPTDEALLVVAALYRVAYLIGEPPTASVAEALELPRSTAGRWVTLARKRGFLGAATPRRAGERRPPRKSRGDRVVETAQATTAIFERALEAAEHELEKDRPTRRSSHRSRR